MEKKDWKSMCYCKWKHLDNFPGTRFNDLGWQQVNGLIG